MDNNLDEEILSNQVKESTYIDIDSDSDSEKTSDSDKITIYEPTLTKINKLENKEILVLSGGGIKGIAFIGALQALKDNKLLDILNIFTGTSIGSLISALHIIGYEPEVMYDFIKKFDLEKMKHINVIHILDKFGLDDRENLKYVIGKLIMAKGIDPNISLLDLYIKTNKKINFTTVCVNTRKAVYLSYETDPNISFIKSIMMSLAIPLYYTPVEHNGCLYIDGGCIDNYSIGLHKNALDKVLGLYLTEETTDVDKICDIETYLIHVLGCLSHGIDFNATKGFESNTITIKLESINIIDYGLNNNKKDELFKCGYDAIVKHLPA